MSTTSARPEPFADLTPFGLVRDGKTIKPLKPASDELVTLNIKRWHSEQKKKANEAAKRKAVTAKVTDGSHAQMGEMLVAKLVKEMK